MDWFHLERSATFPSLRDRSLVGGSAVVEKLMLVPSGDQPADLILVRCVGDLDGAAAIGRDHPQVGPSRLWPDTSRLHPSTTRVDERVAVRCPARFTEQVTPSGAG